MLKYRRAGRQLFFFRLLSFPPPLSLFSLFMFFVNLSLKNCFPLRDRETSLSSRPPLYYCCPSSSRLLFHTHAAKSPMKLIFKEHPSIKFFQSARSARLSLIPSDVTRFTFFLVFLFPFDTRVVFSIIFNVYLSINDDGRAKMRIFDA